ncbi:MAG: hypothetical protein L3J65_00895 [Robiginitomaculum sp.]|nr:hypothetical protein [Robiginitomaculum sp.]
MTKEVTQKNDNKGGGALGIFRQPPFIGIIAFLAVFIVQPLGHIIMLVMEKVLIHGDLWYSQFFDGPPDIPEGFENYAGIDNIIYLPAFVMGVVGIWIIMWGVKKDTEVAGTWAGFIGSSLLWTGWVEFSLHYHARYFAVKSLCDDGTYAFACATKPATKPEYFLMQGSVGFLLVIMLYFMLNKETRCNMFRWMHRHMRITVGKPSRGLTRNFSNNVAIENITILWFFYVFLMIIYDETWFGETHWVTYLSFGLILVWSVYLFQRLLRFKRGASALRYAIPTAIIFFNLIEISGRWGWFDEYWGEPMDHPIASTLTVVALAAFAYISIKTARDKTKQINQK